MNEGSVEATAAAHPQNDLCATPRPVEQAALCLLWIAAVSAWVGVPSSTLATLRPDMAPSARWLLAVAVGASMALLGWLFSERFAKLLRQRALPEKHVRVLLWVISCCALGLLLRIFWALQFPVVPTSDGATYISLAQRLLSERPYEAGGTRAYWPPGYPFFLMPWLAAVPQVGAAVLLSNLALFVLGACGIHRLAHRLAGDGVARAAVLLFAVWPNLVTLAGVPAKELVLASLMPWVLLLALSREGGPPARAASLLGCGLILGAATLVQPALQLFPAVLALYWWFTSGGLRRVLVATLVVVLGMTAVISPWTARNQRVFGEFVLVSTNGGFGLYGANNPRATGGYYEHWNDEPVFQMSELKADREAKRLAWEWIKANPKDFITLAAIKNAWFMGDDSMGPYASLRLGTDGGPSKLYVAIKGLTNAWWLLYWTALLMIVIAIWRSGLHLQPGAAILTMAFSYSLLMHTIVESSGKYHILHIGTLCVLLPILASDLLVARCKSGDWPRKNIEQF